MKRTEGVKEIDAYVDLTNSFPAGLATWIVGLKELKKEIQPMSRRAQ